MPNFNLFDPKTKEPATDTKAETFAVQPSEPEVQESVSVATPKLKGKEKPFIEKRTARVNCAITESAKEKLLKLCKDNNMSIPDILIYWIENS